MGALVDNRDDEHGRFGTRSVVRNMGWLALDVFTRLINQVVSLALFAHYLGPSGLGVLSYGYALLTLALAFGNGGIERVTIRELIARPEEQGTVMASSLLLRSVAQALGCFAMAGVLLVKPADSSEDMQVQLVTVFIGMLFVLDVFELHCRSHMRSRIATQARVGSAIVGLAVRVVLVVSQTSLVWLALCYAVEPVVFGLILVWRLRRQGEVWRPRFWPNLALVREITGSAWKITLSGMLFMLSRRLDQVLVPQFLDVGALGIYVVAARICDAFYPLSTVIIIALFPRAAYEHGTNSEAYERTCRSCIAALSWFGLLAIVGVVVFGKWTIILLFGARYEGAYLPLLFMVVGFLFACNSGLRASHLTLCRREIEGVWIYAAVVISLCILIFFLVPRFGLVGFGMASAIAQLVGAWVAPLALRDSREFLKIQFRGLSPMEILHVVTRVRYVLRQVV